MARPKEFDESRALDSATSEFWSGSFGGTSTQNLCAATGLSRSSLYNTFTCKSDLYRRALKHYSDDRERQRLPYLERDGSGRELLEELLLDTLTEQQHAPDRRGCFVVNAAVEIGDSDPAIAELARSGLKGFEELLRHLIERGQRDGSLSSGRPAATLAPVVHAALNGLQVSGRVSDDPGAGARAVHTLIELI